MRLNALEHDIIYIYSGYEYDTGYHCDSIFSEHTQHRGLCADPTPFKYFQSQIFQSREQLVQQASSSDSASVLFWLSRSLPLVQTSFTYEISFSFVFDLCNSIKAVNSFVIQPVGLYL